MERQWAAKPFDERLVLAHPTATTSDQDGAQGAMANRVFL
jgi:hypothetical protein